MLNIVIPMAGRGSRFAKEGYAMPKPLIDVHGKPMIEVVTNNIRPKCEHKFIYLCLQEHLEKYNLENRQYYILLCLYLSTQQISLFFPARIKPAITIGAASYSCCR